MTGGHAGLDGVHLFVRRRAYEPVSTRNATQSGVGKMSEGNARPLNFVRKKLCVRVAYDFFGDSTHVMDSPATGGIL
jgi:hypothetical protein